MDKAKILSTLIKDKGYNVREFAKKCQIPESTLYTILKNGVGRASMDNILIICKNLGIRVEELEEMATGSKAVPEPTYKDIEKLIARNGKHMSDAEKLELIKMLSKL